MHNNHNSSVHSFRVIVLCFISYCPGATNLLGLYLKDYYRFEHETSGLYQYHALHKNRNPPPLNFRVIAPCYCRVEHISVTIKYISMKFIGR